jgi:hypothetical protein
MPSIEISKRIEREKQLMSKALRVAEKNELQLKSNNNEHDSPVVKASRKRKTLAL